MVHIPIAVNNVGCSFLKAQLHRCPIQSDHSQINNELQYREILVVLYMMWDQFRNCNILCQLLSYMLPNSLSMNWKIVSPVHTIIAWCHRELSVRIAIASLLCIPNDCTSRPTNNVYYAPNSHDDNLSMVPYFGHLLLKMRHFGRKIIKTMTFWVFENYLETSLKMCVLALLLSKFFLVI